MKLTLGFSPCPNDTFIFDALVNKKIDTGDIEIEACLEDVQTLNQWAKQGKLDISKVSYGVLPKITEKYWVLNSGGALGQGVGPLLIAKQQLPDARGETEKIVNDAKIAIPGEDTTAHFLFSQAYPHAHNKIFLRFDEIENFVAEGEGLGVIIHENRFTYQQKGLIKITDLGDYWEKTTNNPIPLGGIVMKRSFDKAIIHQVDHLIRNSLNYAFDYYPSLSPYVHCHAQEMSEEVMRKHIGLYVNNFSLNLGEQGKSAILQMMKTLGEKAFSAHSVFAFS